MADLSQEYEPDTLDVPGKNSSGGQSASVAESAMNLQRLPPGLLKWERYQIVDFLGAGAMGTVFKAQDPRLNRFVALKFIKDADASRELALRFYREARSQAGIEHEYICKIYEVGEVEGQPYIAMQYIEGETLTTGRNKLSLPQKVQVIKLVAEALHAAHRQGMIHRDVKPGNIMIEPTVEGGVRPYVLDFGLADIIQNSGGVVAAGVEGTPAYMSPEQARGEQQVLDRRTDVYSLGATLYDLLAGQPPFGKGPNEEIFLSLLVAEAKPLHAVNTGIPSDLDAIVMKCLEKDPAERYPSARALADDLQRYLDGDAVAAKQANLFYRLQKKAQKNKIVVTTAILAVLSLLVFAVIFIRSRVQAAEQARRAQQFGQTIKEIEMFMRYANALPLHDTRLEKALIRDRMAGISRGLSGLDGEALALARYALGRGHLTLQENEKALEDLQAAYALGLQTPAVEYALGRTLGEIYNKQYKDILRGSPKRRAIDKARIDTQYLAPALQHLQLSGGRHGESRPLAEGFVAYYNQQFEEAKAKAQEALQQEPWLYEAKKLLGDVYYASGRARQNKGLYSEARVDYRRAAELYHDAADMARSDSSIHAAEADMWVQVMDVDRTQGISPKEAFERALAAVDRAIVANSENDSAVRKKVWALTRWAEYQSSHGEDLRGTARQAIAAGQQAISLNPFNALPQQQIGLAYLLMATYEHDHGIDSTAAENAAAAAFQKSLEINANFAWAWNDFGMLHSLRADWLASIGQDYRSELDNSIGKLKHAIDADPDYFIAYSNLVHLYQQMARYEAEHGRTADMWIDRALETSTQSLQANPNYYQTYRNIASTHLLKAQLDTNSGKPMLAHLDKALENLNQAIKANPNDADSHRVLAEVYALQTEDALHRDTSADEALSRGLQAIQRSVLISPSDVDSYLLQVRLLLLAAQADRRKTKVLPERLQEARGVAIRARDLNPRFPLSQVSVAEVNRAAAEWLLLHKKPATAEIADGMKALDEALLNNNGLSLAHAVRGALLVLAAKSAKDRAMRVDLAQQAVRSLKDALQKNPALGASYRAILGEAAQLGQVETPPN